MSSSEDYRLRYEMRALPPLAFFLTQRAKDIRVNEHDVHGWVLLDPDIVGNWLNAGQPIFLRKEPTLSRRRADMLVWFYGASSYDIIEFKWDRELLTTRTGKITMACDRAIEKLMENVKAVSAGRAKLEGSGLFRKIPTPDYPPRGILIGKIPTGGADDEEDDSIIENALRSSRWWEYREQGILLVTTFRSLWKKSQPGTITDEESGHYSGTGNARLLRKRLIRDAISWSFQSRLGCPFNRMQFEKDISQHADDVLLSLQNSPPRSFRIDSAAIAEEGLVVIDRLIDSGLLSSQCIDASLVNALLLLSDLLFYEQDGDLPCGRWEHGSTYPAIHLLECHPELTNEISKRLTDVVRLDTSEDAIEIATHLARTMPQKIGEMWQEDSILSARWPFQSVDRLTDPGTHPLAIAHVHVGYTSALHGNNAAAGFMNACAKDPVILADIAVWNKMHSARNPNALVRSIEEKAKNPTPKLRTFHEYHKAVFQVTRQMI